MFRRNQPQKTKPLGGLAWVHPKILIEERLPPMLFEPKQVKINLLPDGHKVTIAPAPPPKGPRDEDIFHQGPLRMPKFCMGDFGTRVAEGLRTLFPPPVTMTASPEVEALSDVSDEELPEGTPPKLNSKPSPILTPPQSVPGPSSSGSKVCRRLKFPVEKVYTHKKFRAPCEKFWPYSSSSESEDDVKPPPVVTKDVQIVLTPVKIPPVKTPPKIINPESDEKSSDCELDSVDESDLERHRRGEPLKRKAEDDDDDSPIKPRRKRIINVALSSTDDEDSDPRGQRSVFTPSPPSSPIASLPPTPGKNLVFSRISTLPGNKSFLHLL